MSSCSYVIVVHVFIASSVSIYFIQATDYYSKNGLKGEWVCTINSSLVVLAFWDIYSYLPVSGQIKGTCI